MNASDVKVGDLVTMSGHTAPPELYGVGLIIKREQLCSSNENAVRVEVRWTGGLGTEPRIGNCHPSCLELKSEAR